jgi:hypothetical protein
LCAYRECAGQSKGGSGAYERRCSELLENGTQGLLVRAEPLGLAEEISRRMVDVVRIIDGALFLDADPTWAGAVNTVLVKKSVRVNELTGSSLCSAATPSQN